MSVAVVHSLPKSRHTIEAMSLPSPRRNSPPARNQTPPHPPVWSVEVRAAIEFLVCIKGAEYKKTHPEFQTPAVDEIFGAAAAAARGSRLSDHLDGFLRHLCTKHYSKCPLQKIGVLLFYALALRGGTATLLGCDGAAPAEFVARGVDWFLVNVVPALLRKRERLLRACETSMHLVYARACGGSTVPPKSAAAALQGMDAAIADLLSKGALPLR